MEEETKEMLVYEIRELRKDVKEINKNLNIFKGTMWAVAMIFGSLGSYITKKFGL